ncbi:N-acetyl-beta-D-galactosaminidase [Aureococcus anophagefferens]|nr:N-acetyl-beta-D-galactosaminidase [Aureococcus anophagefferens]
MADEPPRGPDAAPPTLYSCSDETMSSRMSMLACACASEFDESAARREERKEDASQGLVVPELPDVAAAFDSAVFAREAESRPDLQRSGSSRRGKRRGKGDGRAKSAFHQARRLRVFVGRGAAQDPPPPEQAAPEEERGGGGRLAPPPPTPRAGDAEAPEAFAAAVVEPPARRAGT